ncbi:MAG: hypothetical protein NC543_08145 [bacterium]|nr:hypothetical protein [bacterium]MCM1373550.1 hypothetical protein [Muribaculum sp.]
MRLLFYYEWKKILGRKVNQIALLLGFMLVIVGNLVLIQQEDLSYNGKELKGTTAISVQGEIESALSPALDEAFLTTFLREYQEQIAGNPYGYDFALIQPKSNLFSLIAKNYTEWNEYMDYETLSTIPTDDGIGFYDRRMEKIETLLNADYSYGNYSEIEKAYWLEKAENVSTPFAWGNTIVWNIIWRAIGMLAYQFFVISICIAPVFAGECQNRTDVLLMTTKYGKNRALIAKILVSLTFAILYITLCGLIGIGMNVLLLGTDGWNLPIQLWDTIYPYEWTVTAACAVNFGVILLIMLFLTAFSLMLSAISRNPLVVLAVDILLFLGTVFLPSSKSSGLWNRILRLFPLHCFDLRHVLSAYNDYPLGELILPYLTMIFLVYGILTVVCALGAVKGFQGRRRSPIWRQRPR